MADSGVNSTSVLKYLSCLPAGRDLNILVSASGLSRKQVLRALGRLMNNKLVVRVGRDLPAFYRVTEKGRAMTTAGRRVTSGPKGPHTAPRKMQQNTFRARLWKAFRVKRKATIPELVEIASGGGEKNPHNNAQQFLRRLVRAGVATMLPLRARGFAPTSNGFGRYALIRDLGPLCPQIKPGSLFDPNSRALIPYREQRP